MKVFNDSTDEDDSSEEFLKQALPVEENEYEFSDESKRFLDPNNYLLYVRKEAAKYPGTLTASTKPGNGKDARNGRCVDEASGEDTEKEHLEELEDVTFQGAGSKKFLNSFSERWMRRQADYFLESQEEFRFAIDVFLPSVSQKSASDELVAALRHERCVDWFLKTPAKLSYFIGLTQDKLTELLEQLLHECSLGQWNNGLQPWLYSTLLALEKPLHPNTYSLLRKIAERFCEHLQIKNYPDGNKSPDKRFCYVIISVIGVAFGQRDIIENL
ncbi:hypothetical protein Aperf_G00000036689 [Anoplocephala perfoliata]